MSLVDFQAMQCVKANEIRLGVRFRHYRKAFSFMKKRKFSYDRRDTLAEGSCGVPANLSGNIRTTPTRW